MFWLKALLSLFSSLAGYFREKQLLDAGSEKQKARTLDAALEKISDADSARNVVPFNGVPDDRNDRDN